MYRSRSSSNRGRDSRSSSRHSAVGRRHRSEQGNTVHIVKFINATDTGRIDLRSLRSFIFQGVNITSNAKLQKVWEMLLENKDNFIVNDALKEPQTLSGNESVWVRTVLGLCKTHCRRGKDGRNRACDGDCGALHVCRTFLLRSENDCPFNSNKKKCMFGHTFDTEHNVELLKAHNLFGLNEPELQKLFRRRPSRTASTLPELCIYYNKADGKRCSRENCKSLHICSDFIQQRCEGHCSRNHKLTTSQVCRILDLFAIDRSWTPEMITEDLKHFMTARHRNNTGSASNDDSDVSDISESGAYFAGAAPLHFSTENGVFDGPSDDHKSSCAGCQNMKRSIGRMQLSISQLTSQVKDLKTEMSNLNSRISAMNGLTNQESDKTLPGNASTLSPSEEEPRFVRSQPFFDYSGVPPTSSHIGGNKVVDETD